MAKETTKTKITRKKPGTTTLRSITTQANRAKKELEAIPAVSTIQQDAVSGIEEVVKLVGTKPQNEGKLSPLGHRADSMAGLMDEAILKYGADFGAVVKHVAKGNPTTRKSNVDDNKALVRRLSSHIANISGAKSNGTRDLEKRLKRVGKEEVAGKVADFLTPFRTLFQDYATTVKF